MENRPPSQPWAPFSCPGLKKPPEVVLQLKVVGLFKEVPFQIAKCTAECLKHSHPDNFKDPIIVPLHEFAWQEFLREKKRELKGETWRYPSTVMCFINDQLMGNEGCLQKWAHKRWGLKDFKPIALYQALTSDYVADYLRNSKHPLVFFEVTVNKRIIGRLIFELYADVCPKTCENFRTLCTGKAGFSQSGIKLHYKNTIFHRLVKNGWLQGGDIYMGKGDGGESIYGPTFEDENFIVPHDKRGVLGMANKGRHTNGSQFYITLQKAPYLDRKYVAFGKDNQREGTEKLQEAVDNLKAFANNLVFLDQVLHADNSIFAKRFCNKGIIMPDEETLITAKSISKDDKGEKEKNLYVLKCFSNSLCGGKELEIEDMPINQEWPKKL